MTSLTGQKAPAFSLPDQSGEIVSLHDFAGKNIVLYFYPKDMTPGCTTEACDFRDRHDQLRDENTVVIGISPDPPKRHQSFIDKHELPFLLLADEEKEAAQAYGVWTLKKNFGKEYMGIERSTFLIDKEGTVVQEWRKVRVKNHADDVLEAVRKLS